MIRPGDLVFDIGAHKGEKATGFLQAGARVVAVEPQPALARALQAKLPEITVVIKACGPEIGTVKLYMTAVSWLATCNPEKWSHGRFNGYKWNADIEVPMTTLDALIEEYGMPAFIKVDVEGYEYEVMRGLSRPVPWISYEFTAEYLIDAIRCANHLMSLGDYEFTATRAVGPVPERYMTVEQTFAELQRPPAYQWGDIYARNRENRL